jgi:hypothetical protein
VRDFAKRLIDYEARGSKSLKSATSDAFDVCEKLRPPFVILMGNAGFRALLARALVLAGDEVSWLRAVHVKSNGALEGWAEIQPPLSADTFLAGRIELVAQMLGLLVAFIGENLTLRLVHEVWPKMPLDDLELDNEEKNAKEI